MSATDLQQPSQPVATVGVTADLDALRAHSITLHNSLVGCGVMFLLSISAMFIGLCMVLIAIPMLFPIHNLTFGGGLAAAQWMVGGAGMMYLCPALWKWSAAMAHKHVKLDARGADFQLGTKKTPVQVFLPWDQITSVEQKRVGNAKQFTVKASDGSYAQFSSYTFFRPRKVARMIAERAGLTIQRG
jgi:hypothetical protein